MQACSARLWKWQAAWCTFVYICMHVCIKSSIQKASVYIITLCVCAAGLCIRSCRFVCMYVYMYNYKVTYFFKNASSVLASSSELYTDQGSIYWKMEGKIPPPNSQASFPKIANELLIPEPGVPGCTNNCLRPGCNMPVYWVQLIFPDLFQIAIKIAILLKAQISKFFWGGACPHTP